MIRWRALKAIYGTPDAVDAFVGIVSEPHVPGTELGEPSRRSKEAVRSPVRW
jgi:hypothetical protein